MLLYETHIETKQLEYNYHIFVLFNIIQINFKIIRNLKTKLFISL